MSFNNCCLIPNEGRVRASILCSLIKRSVLFCWVTLSLSLIFAASVPQVQSKRSICNERLLRLNPCQDAKRSIQLEASLLLKPTSHGNFLTGHFYSTFLFVYASKCSIDQWSFRVTAAGFMASNMNPIKTLFNNITKLKGSTWFYITSFCQSYWHWNCVSP